MSDTISSSGTPHRQPIFWRWIEVALILVVFFVVAGDPPPNVNEPHYLCRLKQYWNPDWCQGDLFLESTDTQVLFIWSLGWMTRWLSLTETAWVGRVVVWTLLAWAWQRLSWRVVPQRLAAVLSAALFVSLALVAHLAGEWVVGGVEAKCFAYVFVLLAIHELIDRRWNAVWFLLGTACAFHPLVGGWSGLVCGGIWLIDHCRHTRLLSMTPGIVAGGLVALLGVLPALSLTRNVPADVIAESARIYVFERLPHHLALLTLPGEELALRLVRHGMLVVALLVLMRLAKKPHEFFAALRPIGQFAVGALILTAIGFSIELALWNHPLIAAKALRYYWFRLADVAVPMAVALYAVAQIAAGLDQRQAWGVWALTLALVAIGWQLSSTARQRAIDPVPPADSQMLDYLAWVDACEWIAENTPPDALFLTPRLSHSFKWRTGRRELVTRKDIPQDAASMVEWFERLKNVFRREVDGEIEWEDSPSKLGTERVRELVEEYGVDYVLAEAEPPLALPVVYHNEAYVVYGAKN